MRDLGEKIDIEINTKYISKGFENGAGNTHIINNGTFLNNFEIQPMTNALIESCYRLKRTLVVFTKNFIGP